MMPGGSLQRGFLNPWPWLLALVLIIGGFLSGYRIGVKATKGEYEAAASKAMTAMIERHNELAKADTAAAVKAETARQAQRANQQEKRHALEMEAASNHRPECSWSDLERGLLNDLVDSANGRAPAAGRVPDGVRQPAAPHGIDGSGGQGLGGKRSFRFWRMSEPAR